MIRPRAWRLATALLFAPVVSSGQNGLVSQTYVWTRVKYQEFGSAIAAAGDVDGDGYGDVVIGSPSEFNTAFDGSITIGYGGSSGIDYELDLLDGISDAAFGASVSWAGDLNHDGYDDVVAGSPLYQGSYLRQGRVGIYFGRALRRIGMSYLTVDVPRSQFGRAVCGPGDVDSDGYNDLVVGAPAHEGPGGGRGALYLFAGGGALRDDPGVVLRVARGRRAGLDHRRRRRRRWRWLPRHRLRGPRL